MIVKDLKIKVKGNNAKGFDIKFLNIPEIEGYPFDKVELIALWVNSNENHIRQVIKGDDIDAILMLTEPKVSISIHQQVDIINFLYERTRYTVCNEFSCVDCGVGVRDTYIYNCGFLYPYTQTSHHYSEKRLRWVFLRRIAKFINKIRGLDNLESVCI